MAGDADNAFALRPEDIVKFLACNTHLGATNGDFQMDQYIWKRKQDGIHIINLKKTWEKLVLAARAIAAVENPAEVFVISARPYGQRAVLKFAAHTGATAVAGRFTPGTFTNQIQKAFREPRLLVVTDPRTDHQAITEACYVNIPVIAFCNTDSPLKLIDIAIPCNNKGQQSVGLLWWMLAREVLIMKGQVSRELSDGRPKFILDSKEVMVDLYFYRDPEEQDKEEQPEKPKDQDFQAERPGFGGEEDFGAQNQMADWNPDAGKLAAAPDFTQPGLDWAAETAQATGQWMSGAAPPAPQAMAQPGDPQLMNQGISEWGGGSATQW